MEASKLFRGSWRRQSMGLGEEVSDCELAAAALILGMKGELRY
jgi:hypothetical protein